MRQTSPCRLLSNIPRLAAACVIVVLPQAVRCEPASPGPKTMGVSDFKSLDRYLRMGGVNEACKTLGIDHTVKIERFLASKISLTEKVMGTKLPGLPKDHWKPLEAVLLKIRNGDYDRSAFDQTKAVMAQESKESIRAACTEMDQILDQEQAMDDLLRRPLPPMPGQE